MKAASNLKSNIKADDANSASVMSTSHSLIDDDHIDDQETINVGNLIIVLEDDLEKEKIENEQASKPNNISANVPTSSSSFVAKASSSTSSVIAPPAFTTGKTPADQRESSSTSSTSFVAKASSSTSSVKAPPGLTAGKSPPEQRESSSTSSTKERGTSTSVGTITEPDCLGPCEPGTSVTLEGIVWQETDDGILVINVTWREKTYVGALLDCTKHDWAPPRFCDSPASDIDSKSNKGVRPKRIVTRSNGTGLDEKNLLQTTGKLRNGKGRRIINSSDLAPCAKKPRESDKSNENIAAQVEANIANVSSITNSENASVSMQIETAPAADIKSISTSNAHKDKAGPNSPMLIVCSEPNCSKKYRNMNGLMYHQSHAHGSDSEPVPPEDNCSSMQTNKQEKPTTVSQEDKATVRESIADNSDQQTSTLSEPKPSNNRLALIQDTEQTPSPTPAQKVHAKITAPNLPPLNTAPINPEQPRPTASKGFDAEKKGVHYPLNSGPSNPDRRSPSTSKHPHDLGPGPSNHSVPKSGPSMPKPPQVAPPPLPATTEEGMKPSGTSTGPPPAPHQPNYYFNSVNSFIPHEFAQFFLRPPLPVYDPHAPPTSSANAVFSSRFLNCMRPPPPESPSRLLSPSVSKSLPYPPFKVDPGSMPMPPLQMTTPPMPNLNPLAGLPMPGGMPHLRLPSQGDPMLPPTSQPPFPPPGMNPNLGPQGLGPMGSMAGPQVPSLVDDPMAKQFPRRFS